jgi:hypothetical protein
MDAFFGGRALLHRARLCRKGIHVCPYKHTYPIYNRSTPDIHPIYVYAPNTPHIHPILALCKPLFPSPSLCARALSLSQGSFPLSVSLSGQLWCSTCRGGGPRGESPCGSICVSHTYHMTPSYVSYVSHTQVPAGNHGAARRPRHCARVPAGAHSQKNITPHVYTHHTN